MLNPTESPSPSLAPRFAASIAPPPPPLSPRARDGAPVEEADRRQVDQIQEEAGVGQRLPQARAVRVGDGPAAGGADRAKRGPRQRDERVVPRIARLVLDQHVRADE